MSIQDDLEQKDLVPRHGSTRRRRKRPDVIAEKVRDQIITADLRVGDRIPADWVLPETLNASRGTVREALKILEIEGLIITKTGPGGGLFVSAIDPEDAIRFLDNLFLSEPPSIPDIYSLRRQLEPELAAGLAGKLSDAQFSHLQSLIYLYEDEPTSAEEEYRQRLAELDFHTGLAALSENRLLGFVCRFLHSLLQDKSECRAIYSEPTPWGKREMGVGYQVQLLRALKQGDRQEAGRIMRAHMIEAEKFMIERAVLLRK
ncbi:FCD domain-containing protein [uncultured Cohaesibacter sp.]|uniref:FadR/GntR family transcriptional regulator n=1 Tax=uncultured Cohaesibacter sp. TaxID=1002546 RepID=UPI0029C9B142|nr:FCD domain-containing protein [uncultured Cohaesibacter sp.]